MTSLYRVDLHDATFTKPFSLCLLQVPEQHFKEEILVPENPENTLTNWPLIMLNLISNEEKSRLLWYLRQASEVAITITYEGGMSLLRESTDKLVSLD